MTISFGKMLGLHNPQAKKYPNDLSDLKINFDYGTFYRERCGVIYSENQKSIMFLKCPICGHEKCFIIYKDNGHWHCFGQNGNCGGRAYYLLSQYHISKFLSHGNGTINEIINSSLNDKEKLDILIFYLFKNYHRFDNNFENKNQLSQDLNLFKQINWQSLFTVEYLNNLNLWIDKFYILNEIIKLIEDKDIKFPLYDFVLEKIKLCLEKELPSGHDILLANVYGQIILDYGEEVISQTEFEYNKIRKMLLKPYTYYRNKKQWNLNICKLIFYTIALFIANYTNAEKCKNLINDFIAAKNELPHYLDNEIKCYIEQLTTQITKLEEHST